MTTLKARREDLDRKISAVQARVEETPRTDQGIGALSRDFRELSENYLTLLRKKLDAQMTAKLERRWKGDHFRILDPANLPDRPFRPRRLLMLAAGAILGLALGLGAAFAADFLDHSITTMPELEAIVALPILATIPFITPKTLHSLPTRGGHGSTPDGKAQPSAMTGRFAKRADQGRRASPGQG